MKSILKFAKAKQYPINEILNERDRLVRAWLTVEIKDLDGEVIPIETSGIKGALNVWMKRGGPIIDTHSNRPIGKALRWAEGVHPKANKPGIFIDYNVFDDYSIDNVVWKEITSGKRKGLSFGGRAMNKPKLTKLMGKYGGVANKLTGIEAYEVSSVIDPSCTLAENYMINYLAKSKKEDNPDVDKLFTDLQKGFEAIDIQKPFAGFEDFEACELAQKKRGHARDSAKRICGWLKHRTEGDEKQVEEDRSDGGNFDVDPDSVGNVGFEQEKEEHPNFGDEQIKQIVDDHLKEDPNYYDGKETEKSEEEVNKKKELLHIGDLENMEGFKHIEHHGDKEQYYDLYFADDKFYILDEGVEEWQSEGLDIDAAKEKWKELTGNKAEFGSEVLAKSSISKTLYTIIQLPTGQDFVEAVFPGGERQIVPLNREYTGKMMKELDKARTYLKPGEKPPKGASVQTGAKGGKYYEEGGSKGKPEPEEGKEPKDELSTPENMATDVALDMANRGADVSEIANSIKDKYKLEDKQAIEIATMSHTFANSKNRKKPKPQGSISIGSKVNLGGGLKGRVVSGEKAGEYRVKITEPGKGFLPGDVIVATPDKKPKKPKEVPASIKPPKVQTPPLMNEIIREVNIGDIKEDKLNPMEGNIFQAAMRSGLPRERSLLIMIDAIKNPEEMSSHLQPFGSKVQEAYNRFGFKSASLYKTLTKTYDIIKNKRINKSYDSIMKSFGKIEKSLKEKRSCRREKKKGCNQKRKV